MNITKLTNNNNQKRIIFLTTNNSTPIKIKRFSFSNSLTSNQNKSRYRNKNKIKDVVINNSSCNSLNNSQKYIFNCYKISPLVALLIYEKAINNLFEFIKKRLPKNTFLEIKKKYISLVTELLHIKSKNILANISEQDLINLNVKLFISTNNNSYSIQYNKINNSNNFYKNNCNSNSLFQLNKNKSKRGKLLSFNSFNNIELKKQNKSLINSSNILFHQKKPKIVYNTDNNLINNNNNNNYSYTSNSKLKKNINHLRNISLTNGIPINLPLKNFEFEIKKKIKDKINKDKKIVNNKKINNCSKNITKENKKFVKEEKKEKNKKKNLIDIKDNEKNSLLQINLIKENLEDNLKNMFNFSYGDFLNNEKESDSSKSLYKLNNGYSNNKQN